MQIAFFVGEVLNGGTSPYHSPLSLVTDQNNKSGKYRTFPKLSSVHGKNTPPHPTHPQNPNIQIIGETNLLKILPKCNVNNLNNLVYCFPRRSRFPWEEQDQALLPRPSAGSSSPCPPSRETPMAALSVCAKDAQPRGVYIAYYYIPCFQVKLL